MIKKTWDIWALFASVYITQYIGVAFILASTVAILRNMGMALDKLAMINIIALPLLLKIFYAPFIDNIRLGFFQKRLQGQYRSWLVTAQFLMMGLLALISQLDIVNHFAITLTLMFIYGLAVSIQDVAIDGLACKLFAENERPIINSIQFSGNLLGNVIGGGIILMAYPWLGWTGALLVLMVLTAISWLQILFFKEAQNPTSQSMSQPSSKKVQISTSFQILWKSLKAFIQQNKSWFGVLMIYPLSIGAGFALVNPILVDAHWQLGDIGLVTKIFGSLVGVLSAWFASISIKKIGKNQTLLWLTLAQALSVLLLILLGMGYTTTGIVYGTVGFYFLINPALMTTIATFAMDKLSQQNAKATFFTLQIGILSFMGFVYASLAMTLAKYMGYGTVLIGIFILALGIFIRVKHFIQKQPKLTMVEVSI